MRSTGGKLFKKEYLSAWEPEDLFLLFSSADVMSMDRERDRLLLENIARNAQGTERKAALRRLGVSEVPAEDPDYVSDGVFDERYWILDEQIRALEEMADLDTLKEAALASSGMAGSFAFCYLTGYRYPPPACDAYSHRTFACGRYPWIGAEETRAFCREMIERQGPFAAEARAWLARGIQDGASDSFGEGRESGEKP